MSLLNEALKYASLGWKVFPVKPDKTPYTPRGFHDATSEVLVIMNWWSLMYPQAGIGIRTGLESGIVVLDIDLHKEGADENFNRLMATKGEFKQSVVAKTGGGGYHIYFKHPGKEHRVGSTTKLFGLSGIDVRGEGGYVIAPPSPHLSGNNYSWEPNLSPFNNVPGECPPWLYVNRESAPISLTAEIPEGHRNSTLTSIAGLLRAMGMDKDTIFTVLSHQNQLRCNPPLDDEELLVISNQISKYPPFRTVGDSIPNTETNTPNIVLQELLTYERTDTGFSQMIAFYLNGKLKYDFSLGKWLLWREHWWEVDSKEELYQRVIEVGDMYLNACGLITDPDDQEAAFRWGRKIKNWGTITSGITLLKSHPYIASTQAEWNKKPNLLGVKNGVIDLTTGDLFHGSPNDYISLSVDIEYSKETECPRWLQFLGEIFNGNTDVIHFIHKAVGYTLSGYTNEQCIFLLIGSGANGKSVFLEVLKALLGPYSFSTPFSTFEKSPLSQPSSNDIAHIANKRLVTASETTAGATFNEARIKSLTGGESVSARFLHREYFEFVPICKIWLGVNHAPRVLDDSIGFWRRVRRVDFPIQFTEDKRDPNLYSKLIEELPGILAWAVRGYQLWVKEGLTPPSSIVSSTEKYRVDSDPIYDFRMLYCIDKSDGYIQVTELYKLYTQYCRSKELKPYEILNSTRFREKISMEYPRKRLSSGVEVYQGLELKPGVTPVVETVKITTIPNQKVQ